MNNIWHIPGMWCLQDFGKAVYWTETNIKSKVSFFTAASVLKGVLQYIDDILPNDL